MTIHPSLPPFPQHPGVLRAGCCCTATGCRDQNPSALWAPQPHWGCTRWSPSPAQPGPLSVPSALRMRCCFPSPPRLSAALRLRLHGPHRREQRPREGAGGSRPGAGCGQTCTFIYKKARAGQDSGIRLGAASHGPCLVGTNLKPLHLLQPVGLGGRCLPPSLPRVFPAGAEGTDGPRASTEP